MVATKARSAARVPLHVGGMAFDQLWLEGYCEDATGKPVVQMKLGMTIPLDSMMEALKEIQLQLRPAPSGPASQQPAGEASARLPEQPVVVKNTFVESAEERPAPGLVRAASAPTGYHQDPDEGFDGEGLEVVEEAEHEDQEEEGTEGTSRAVGGCGLGDKTLTISPFEYDAAEPLTWYGQGPPVLPAGLAPPLPPPVMFPAVPPAMAYAGMPVPGWPSLPEPAAPSLPTTRPVDTEATGPQDTPTGPSIPRSLESEMDTSSGCCRITWSPSSRKLDSTDTHPIVSPEIHLAFGEQTEGVPFKMMIRPKARGDKKGEGSFGKANKMGQIELSCIGNGCQLSFNLAIGSGRSRITRGPFTHNFTDRSVFSVPKGQGFSPDWDFQKAIDSETNTFSVHLEVLQEGEPCRCLNVSGGEAPKPTRW